MEVALIDRSGGTDFEIRTLNRTDQYLELDDYSEWIFFVKPVVTGTRKLYLKISTVQKIEGESMKKEIVLERAVEVVASEQFMMTNLHWTDSQIVLSSQKEIDHFIALNFLSQSPLLRRTLIVLFFISLSAGMYALVQHFKLSVHDLGAKISKAHEFKGNANCKWYVKRVLGSNSGVKVD